MAESGMKSIPLWFLALFSLAVGTAYAQDSAEAAKIRYLIAAVETLEGAQFIRNGRAYDAKAAADHLRLKLKTAGNQVKTADDFIRFCGSRSSLSGERYQIRLADGATVDSEVFFRNRLKTLPADKP
jgi:hypothetical protein